MNAPRFVVDVMLGRLTHWLRAMGYDTIYDGRADDDRLLALSVADDRILITLDTRLAQAAGGRGCLIRMERVDLQLIEVIERDSGNPIVPRPAPPWASDVAMQ